MANQSHLLNYLMADDRLVLKQILVVLGVVVASAGFYLVVIIAIGALEMVGINANIPNRTSYVTIFLFFVGHRLFRFFGLFEENFGMSYADRFLAFIDHLLKEEANESINETNDQTKEDTPEEKAEETKCSKKNGKAENVKDKNGTN